METAEKVWSTYQDDIFIEVTEGFGSVCVIARAGVGKTTTAIEAIKRLLNRYGQKLSNENIEAMMNGETITIIFLAFNAAISKELQSKVPAGASASTFHSLGFRSLGNFLRKRLQVNANKNFGILRAMQQSGEISQYVADNIGASAMKLVGLAKSEGIGCLVPDSDQEWLNLISKHDIELDEYDDEALPNLLKLARRILDRSVELSRGGEVDFDDQLYCCIKFPVIMSKFDYVFIDEAQDTNSIQRAIVKKILKPGGKIVAIGDDRQAIYGFRGAGTDSMNLIKNEFNCRVLTLPVSYRCSKAVIREAQKYVPDIQFAENAPEGYVGSVDNSEFRIEWNIKCFESTDAVLCRNTAPLITLAYHLINNKVACKVLGREIGAGLTSLIKKLKPNGLKGLEIKLGEYRSEQVSKFLAKGEENKAQAVEDKVDSIFAAMDSLAVDATVPDLIRHIESLFNHRDDEEILTLSTVHKSKGREWKNVYLLDRGLMPSKYARQTWQQDQEKNLQYVATTRAMLNLFFITSEMFKKSPVETKEVKV